MQPIPPINEVVDTFQFFDNWEDRYRFLIELGERLPPLDPAEQTESNRVVGCVSKVWIIAKPGSQGLIFRGDSDAATVKGLVAVLISLYSGKNPAQIQALDADAVFQQLRLYDHLSPTRHVGVYAMVEKIKQIAHDAANKRAAGTSQETSRDAIGTYSS